MKHLVRAKLICPKCGQSYFAGKDFKATCNHCEIELIGVNHKPTLTDISAHSQ